MGTISRLALSTVLIILLVLGANTLQSIVQFNIIMVIGAIALIVFCINLDKDENVMKE